MFRTPTQYLRLLTCPRCTIFTFAVRETSLTTNLTHLNPPDLGPP